MKANEVKRTAIEVIKSARSCKAISKVFPELVEKYGKVDAIKIRDAAKAILKLANDATKENANNVIRALSNGERVAKCAWKDILKDKSINKFALKVWEVCNQDIISVINTFAKYKDANGNACRRVNSKVGGVYFKRFNIETASVPSALAMLKQAIRNAKTAAISEKTTYKYMLVTPKEEETI